jgi:hypothetical protein
MKNGVPTELDTRNNRSNFPAFEACGAVTVVAGPGSV